MPNEPGLWLLTATNLSKLCLESMIIAKCILNAKWKELQNQKCIVLTILNVFFWNKTNKLSPELLPVTELHALTPIANVLPKHKTKQEKDHHLQLWLWRDKKSNLPMLTLTLTHQWIKWLAELRPELPSTMALDGHGNKLCKLGGRGSGMTQWTAQWSWRCRFLTLVLPHFSCHAHRLLIIYLEPLNWIEESKMPVHHWIRSLGKFFCQNKRWNNTDWGAKHWHCSVLAKGIRLDLCFQWIIWHAISFHVKYLTAATNLEPHYWLDDQSNQYLSAWPHAMHKERFHWKALSRLPQDDELKSSPENQPSFMAAKWSVLAKCHCRQCMGPKKENA